MHYAEFIHLHVGISIGSDYQSWCSVRVYLMLALSWTNNRVHVYFSTCFSLTDIR